MPNSNLSLALPLTLLIASCAAAPLGAGDETTGSADQADTTILDDCAVGHAANATAVTSGSDVAYTRSAATINAATHCDCADWQQDENLNGEAQADADHPTCRPDTFLDILWEHSTVPPWWWVVVQSWNVANATECNNSTLNVSLWEQTSPNVWTKQSEQTVNAVWDVNSNVCSPTSISGNDVTYGVLYRIHARATRGLAKNNHGYETVTIALDPPLPADQSGGQPITR